MPFHSARQGLSAAALALCVSLGLGSSIAAGQEHSAAFDGARLLSVQRIGDRAAHNAFTDLLFHEGRWYCVFREGTRHVSADGCLRVLGSKDGEHWESLALLSHPSEDLRDAKLCVAPDGRLMLNGAGMRAEEEVRYHSMVWFSADSGESWTEGQRIGDPGYWLWRVQWHEGKAYSFGYSTHRDRETRDLHLYRSSDGQSFERFVDTVEAPKGMGEDAILFGPEGAALCLMRREAGSKSSQLGRSKAPYQKWSWQDLGIHLGGPNMIRIPDGRIIAAARLYQPQQRTALLWLDPDSGALTEFLQLPSGGDTSYPGLVFHESLLWISYYSSHEGKSCIYLAKVQLGPRER